MPTRRRRSLILLLLALPSLAGCGEQARQPPAAPPAGAVIAASTGVPQTRLAEEVGALFADPAAGETRTLLVLRDGATVAEAYAPGFGPKTRQIGWSLSKCVTAVMIGMLVADGRLRLDETAPVPAWQRPGDPRGAVTVRMLLQMRSGLEHREGFVPATDTMRQLFLDGRDDMAGFAEAKPLADPPGLVFQYSTASSIILSDLAARVLAARDDPESRRRAVLDYLRSRLLDPAGMAGMVPEFDRRGTMIGGAMIWGTARDWGRLGEFLRRRGSAGGAQLVPSGWIDFMLAPSPANAAYGGQIWLNRAAREQGEMLFAGKAPRDLFACVGAFGQYLIVSPSQRLTIVRLGRSDTRAKQRVLRDHLQRIITLFPKPRG
ncbi:MAG: serine hydrolase [Novosphingobium sp.]